MKAVFMKKSKWIIIIVLVLLLIFILSRCAKENKDSETPDLASGIGFLQTLEQRSPDNVDAILKEQREQEILEMRDERLRQLENEEISVWTLFEDYVLLGDSRAIGFSFYLYLPEDRVIAEGGATIRHLQQHIPDIVEMHPSNIFLCYGLNDVSIGIWPTPEDYIAEFAETIQAIQAELPDADIYVSSILPARDPAFETSTAWYNIPEYSAEVGKMCETIDNCYFVNNDEISEKYADMWESDGVHLQRYFYQHWATNLIMEYYMNALKSDNS